MEVSNNTHTHKEREVAVEVSSNEPTIHAHKERGRETQRHAAVCVEEASVFVCVC